MQRTVALLAGMLVLAATSKAATAAEIKVLSAGAFKQVILAVQPVFEKETGHKVHLDNDTVGALSKPQAEPTTTIRRDPDAIARAVAGSGTEVSSSSAGAPQAALSAHAVAGRTQQSGLMGGGRRR